ncbi:MAG TPA: hypothetical protein VM778_04675 [Gemmatimonadota bacterium]|nr:hypothetical protein [Gemmatimonadota bacterium]
MTRKPTDLHHFDHRRYRRVLRWALPVVAAVHTALLAWMVLPGSRTEEARRSLFVIPMSEITAERRRPEPAAPREASPASETPAATPIVATPVESPHAPETETIAPTALRALAAPIQPLEVAPDGRIRPRTLGEPDPRALAIARAESIVHARLADIGVKSRRDRGSIYLAEGGGVTIEIPWQGFVREDRKDEVWRRERCAGEDGEKADKPGEAEGRASQCG